MRYAIIIFLLLIACTVDSVQQTHQEPTPLLGQDITIEQAQTMQDAIIIDIRTPEEFSQGHIPKAINIDYYADDFEEQIALLDKEKTYIVHCKSGGRSSKAMPLFSQLKAHNMLGGYDEWVAAGYPIVN